MTIDLVERGDLWLEDRPARLNAAIEHEIQIDSHLWTAYEAHMEERAVWNKILKRLEETSR